MLKALIEHIVKSLVDQPEHVAIVDSSDDQKVVIKITVASEDVGRVIGKDGQTIRALRSLAIALGEAGRETIVEVAR